jgi:hypothetical protein
VDDRGLERALGELLGFSPEMLGASVLEPFNLNQELSGALEEEANTGAANGESTRTAKEIAELCRVGEALARANDPEHYPQSAHSWTEAKTVINSILGDEGLKRVQDTYDTYSASYREAGSGILGTRSKIDPDQHKAEHDQAATRERNPYVEACPLHLKQRLREFYAWRTPEKNPQEAVAHLLREVVPVSGFEAGVVYTLDPSFSELVPRLKFGQVSLRRVASHKVSEDSLSRDSVLSALQVPAPCVSRVAGQDRSFVVGALGTTRKIGVFYVEFSSGLAEQDHIDVTVMFKALCQSLLDALGIAN